MRYFIDSEFLEDGATIMPISLALVAENNDDLYLEFDFDEQRVRDFSDPFVRDNVLPHLRWPVERRLSLEQARDAVEGWIIARERPMAKPRRAAGKPEFWGYYAAYDWVLLCRLWGRMIDLPPWMPMHCLDVQQEWVRRGCDPALKPKQPSNAHDALVDAKWTKAFYALLHADSDQRLSNEM